MYFFFTRSVTAIVPQYLKTAQAVLVKLETSAQQKKIF
jgi:hypothetical protein